MFGNLAKVTQLTRGTAKLIMSRGSLLQSSTLMERTMLWKMRVRSTAPLSRMARWKRRRMPGRKGQGFSSEWQVPVAIGREKYQEFQSTGRYGTRFVDLRQSRRLKRTRTGLPMTYRRSQWPVKDSDKNRMLSTDQEN
jgi:hypothetical protein